MAIILRNKYFPNRYVLKIAIPNFSSYLLKNVILGRELCKDRLKWRIGNEDKVFVYKDPILHFSTPFKLIFSRVLLTST